jgi:hypothetical protein
VNNNTYIFVLKRSSWWTFSDYRIIWFEKWFLPRTPFLKSCRRYKWKKHTLYLEKSILQFIYWHSSWQATRFFLFWQYGRLWFAFHFAISLSFMYIKLGSWDVHSSFAACRPQLPYLYSFSLIKQLQTATYAFNKIALQEVQRWKYSHTYHHALVELSSSWCIID